MWNSGRLNWTAEEPNVTSSNTSFPYLPLRLSWWCHACDLFNDTSAVMSVCPLVPGSITLSVPWYEICTRKKNKSNASVYFYRCFTDVELPSRIPNHLLYFYQVLTVFTLHKCSGFTWACCCGIWVYCLLLCDLKKKILHFILARVLSRIQNRSQENWPWISGDHAGIQYIHTLIHTERLKPALRCMIFGQI